MNHRNWDFPSTDFINKFSLSYQEWFLIRKLDIQNKGIFCAYLQGIQSFFWNIIVVYQTDETQKVKSHHILLYKTRSEKGSINHDFADISRVAFNDFGRHHRSCVRQHILIQHSAQCFFFSFLSPHKPPCAHWDYCY